MDEEMIGKKLLDAAEEGDIPLLSELVAKGAFIHYRDYDGRNALFYAVINNQIKAIEFLKKVGIDLNDRDVDGETALISAVHRNHIEVIEKLCELGAKVDIQDNLGKTALIHSIEHRNLKSVYILLTNNAKYEIRDNSNMNAIDKAKDYQFAFLVPFLEKRRDDRPESLKELYAIAYNIPDERIDEEREGDGIVLQTEDSSVSGNDPNPAMMPIYGILPIITQEREDDDLEQELDTGYVPTQEDFDNAFTDKDVPSEEEATEIVEPKGVSRPAIGIAIFFSIGISFVMLFLDYKKSLINTVYFYIGLSFYGIMLLSGIAFLLKKKFVSVLLAVLFIIQFFDKIYQFYLGKFPDIKLIIKTLSLDIGIIISLIILSIKESKENNYS